MKVVTVAEMVAVERWTAAHGTSLDTLMDRAGLATALAVERTLGSVLGKRVVIAIGPGNNGGDGLVAAAELADRGALVFAGVVPRKADPDRPRLLAQLRPIAWCDLSEAAGQERFTAAAGQADVVVDSLFGTGHHRPISGPAAVAISVFAHRPADVPLIAVDLPSGLNGDTGEVDRLTPAADLTVTFGAPKLGLYLAPGSRCAGSIEIADIGIPADAFAPITRELIDQSLIGHLAPARPIDGHKGTFGKVLIVAGSERYVGAAALAGLAAYRGGAGLVTIATARSVYHQLAGRILETTFVPLAEDPPGQIAESAVPPVLAATAGYDSVVLGPGLGRAAATDAFVRGLLPQIALPTVVDADALNALSAADDWPSLLPPQAVLTPHSGELSRLRREPIAAIEADRPAAATTSATGWKTTVILKGAFTLVANADGRLRFSPWAVPALATAGSGDVLSGLIGAYLAQGLSPFDAATLAVDRHARAGAHWASRHTGGMLAGDLIDALRVER